ncbi:hypothetical protein MOMA_08521 [Moraxella macacae 0408225]|uniref:Transmembrane protein n=1 Tax=Moraxella macacae 0408225 TaxID=1230338 RepID=L2F6E7_9GAMM|nr:hypothetical protein [Moraxella macacae]ELA08592.1 hypothetical protein MOMA_08521 [Moraxella macacae 0408225]
MQQSTTKPTHLIHRTLTISYVTWLIFRIFGIALILYASLTEKPSLIAIMFWQTIWLIPALCCTPFIRKGKSTYALLFVSILLLIYAGASGFMVFLHGFAQFWWGMIAWFIDFCLVMLANICLFILLKRLPKMNR